ncbi:MAG TPA: hypothetical protein VNJ46_01475 [Gaiellaceae bacterium]|nr:hypothetical protein [Gaiellaceae bacterium]
MAAVAETVSPELVLVDAALAERARLALPEPQDTLARRGEILSARRTMRLLARVGAAQVGDWEGRRARLRWLRAAER